MEPEVFTYSQLAIFDDDANVRYVPFVSAAGRVGYIVRSNDPAGRPQRVTHIYLNPCAGSTDNRPNVFLYIGEYNDPDSDEPQHHYDIDGVSYEEPIP